MREHFDFYGYNAPTWGRYYHDGQTYFLGEDFRSVKRYKEYKNIGFNMCLLHWGDKKNMKLSLLNYLSLLLEWF